MYTMQRINNQTSTGCTASTECCQLINKGVPPARGVAFWEGLKRSGPTQQVGAAYSDGGGESVTFPDSDG